MNTFFAALRWPASHSKSLASLFSVLLLCSVTTSCKKFLDEKSDQSLAVPSSLKDLQLLMDSYTVMNNQYPHAAEILSDNFYLSSADWGSLSNQTHRNIYLWKHDDDTGEWWTLQYRSVFNTNVILDNLAAIPFNAAEASARDAIKGSALFIRASYFYGLAQLFATPYNTGSAGQSLGIPLRLTSDYNEPSVRATVQQTYDQVISDFKQAAALLPVNTALKTRPSKPAAFGALARTYLAMKDYENAGLYADSCLALYDSLIDYNTLNAAASAPISRFNKEVIFHQRSSAATPLANARAKVDSVLYSSYATNDLRKAVLFKSNGNGTYQFKGDYDGSGTATGYVFAGIVTDEVYLIRAECFARLGNTVSAMQTLNLLLQKRWKTGTFIPLNASGPADALTKIIAERRKELLFRGTRWTDIRRLIDEPSFAINPKRVINGQLYEFPADGYLLQIPRNVIDLTGMPQNP